MVRRSALNQVGGWGTDTICEDTELGLRLYEAGYQALYTNYRYGRGHAAGHLQGVQDAALPLGVRGDADHPQALDAHAARCPDADAGAEVPLRIRLVAVVRRCVGDAASVLNLLWVPVIVLVGVVIPTIAFTVPIMAAFVVNLLHCVLLYGKRVRMPCAAGPGCGDCGDEPAVDGGACGAGRHGAGQPAVPRTEKGGNAKRGSDNPALWETVLGVGLVLSAVLLFVLNTTNVIEMTVFASTLLVQSIPFLAAA